MITYPGFEGSACAWFVIKPNLWKKNHVMLALSCRLQLNFIFRLIIRHNLALKLGTCGRKGRSGDDHGVVIWSSTHLILLQVHWIYLLYTLKKKKPNLDLSLEFFSFGRFPFFSLLLFSLFLKIRIKTKKKIDRFTRLWIELELIFKLIQFDLIRFRRTFSNFTT